MTSFPEENLDSPVGYLPGYPGMTLQSDKWTISRKLGWGPRSSVWLACNTTEPTEYRAIKVFTLAESKGAALQELHIHRTQDIQSANIVVLRDSFEEGGHLCFVLDACGLTIEHLRCSNVEGGYVASHTAKQLANWTVCILSALQDLNLVHGAIATDHIVLGELDPDDIATAGPTASFEYLTTDNRTYPLVKSQPIDISGWDTTWNEPATEFASKTLFLLNMGHASSPRNLTTDSSATFTTKGAPPAPEVLLGQSIGFSSDVWQLGWMIFLLITGTPLVDRDLYMKAPIESLAKSLQAPALENRLSRNSTLSRADLAPTASLLRSLLASDHSQRPSVDELFDVEWIERGDVCVCGWCRADTNINVE